MAITKSEFSAYIKAFQFRELFNEMGWNNDRTKQPIIVDDISFNISGIAEKSGFRIFICEPPSGNKIPDSATRKKIENKVTKLFQEHLIVFIDEQRKEQVWQLAVRKAGSPTKISETRYSISQDPELLYQRASGLFFTLDEEERVTIIDVTSRVAENFQQNNERVTKKFYESFKKEHTAFLKFIEGIDDQLNMDWYASLMLNRLMFCYFIQKKGFLDDNKNYLQDKLKACKEKKGKNQFYSFYRDFLLALFHKGLGEPKHSENLEVEIGKIPYLNGGLFDKHEIERNYQDIIIDDKAFEKLFDFFDQYEWHLDTRESASGKDINPDVIGYIFEKYINDRAQMGAYYTKEDITDYISKNCIVPWLFDEVNRRGGFGTRPYWQIVKASGDEYIYDAVKYGVPEHGGLFDDLPAEIQKGFGPELGKKVVDGNGPWLWELRKSWNKPAPSDIALPTETYREVIERRKRYGDIKTKIESGEIKEINDFITYNLNIRQFAQDVIETTADAEFILHFYKALFDITILDPTCGSGAFLFAAMNILEPLYEACIHRMKNFVDEENINHGLTQINTDEERKGHKKYVFFAKILKQVNAPEHPNLQYFIYKSIILNNLYGVDIMNEAVEIAKLRLFLKLVATVDADYHKPNLGLEPLPDVDFNIRAGNTLVGYAAKKQIDNIAGLFVTDAHKKKILEQCDIVARAFARYKEIQLSSGDDYDGFKKAKDDLNERLKKLTDDLDGILYMEQYKGFSLEGEDYQKWLATHQPFHWFAEFYEIVQGNGGFDVVIGNPPYVEYTQAKKVYQIVGYETLACGNIYVNTIERCSNILSSSGSIGMIVQLPIVCTDRMIPIQKLLITKFALNIYATFDDRPGKLFDGLEHIRATILIVKKQSKEKAVFSTSYSRWNTEYRSFLFDSISFLKNENLTFNGAIPKVGNINHRLVLNNLQNHKPLANFLHGSHTIYFHNAPQYWIRATIKPPYFWNEKDGKKTSVQVKSLSCTDKAQKAVACSILNSSLFYLWFLSLSDCRHLNMREIKWFPVSFGSFNNKIVSELNEKVCQLMESLEKNKYRKETYYKATGKVIYDEYYPKLSKPIIDQIDCLLAQHYGFTHEELDFIINYDIKYRMGKELDSDEEE
ncbi:MAG: DNA methyltransferase [bacterium]